MATFRIEARGNEATKDMADLQHAAESAGGHANAGLLPRVDGGGAKAVAFVSPSCKRASRGRSCSGGERSSPPTLCGSQNGASRFADGGQA